MIKISIDRQAIKDQYGTFANYARQHNLNATELSQTKLYLKESNASLNQMLKNGFVTVKEVKEEEIA